jgi:hypothetical protein
VQQLLRLPAYRDVSEAEVIYRAEVRLGLARLGAIKGISVRDRVTAIALLEGIRDNTAEGMVA